MVQIYLRNNDNVAGGNLIFATFLKSFLIHLHKQGFNKHD